MPDSAPPPPPVSYLEVGQSTKFYTPGHCGVQAAYSPQRHYGMQEQSEGDACFIISGKGWQGCFYVS